MLPAWLWVESAALSVPGANALALECFSIMGVHTINASEYAGKPCSNEGFSTGKLLLLLTLQAR